MRRHTAWMVRSVFAIGILFLLCHAGNQLKHVQRLERLGVYELNTPVTAKNAEVILEEAVCREPEAEETKAGETEAEETGAGETEVAKQEDACRIIFFTEQKGKTVENGEWYRQTEADVVEVYGDSTLLFPYAYPLEPEDTKGCLLGEETAIALFGGRKVVGEQIIYEGKTYEIRGILQGKNQLVIQALEETPLCNAGVLGDTAAGRKETVDQLQNAYGIGLEEIPFRFYETILRAKIAVLCLFLYIWAGALFCRALAMRFAGKVEGTAETEKTAELGKTVKKAVIAMGIVLTLVGVFYVMSFNAYTMPDKISDLSWWGNYFSGEWAEWKRFLGREEMFLQEEFRKCMRW